MAVLACSFRGAEKQAAENEQAEAQTRLGMRFANGNGVEKDILKSVEWLSRAALNEDADAEVYLVSVLTGIPLEQIISGDYDSNLFKNDFHQFSKIKPFMAFVD